MKRIDLWNIATALLWGLALAGALGITGMLALVVQPDAFGRPVPRVVTAVGDIVILRHTYDGPELIDGRLLDWQYGYDGMQIELRDRGDGIFRHDFEEPSCRP